MLKIKVICTSWDITKPCHSRQQNSSVPERTKLSFPSLLFLRTKLLTRSRCITYAPIQDGSLCEERRGLLCQAVAKKFHDLHWVNRDLVSRREVTGDGYALCWGDRSLYWALSGRDLPSLLQSQGSEGRGEGGSRCHTDCTWGGK